MPMPGDILADARRSAPELERGLGHADPELAARLRTATATQGETSAAYLRISVADFGRFPAEEDWATLEWRLA